jgi:formyl-CoA transferase
MAKTARKTKSRTAGKKTARKALGARGPTRKARPAARRAKKVAPAMTVLKPSEKPWGQAGKALDGIRVLDMTHVQSGPTCTQLLAWFGADVIKVELPGRGDITRGQLRDLPHVDSLYFTMLNCNKRSITLNTKHDIGKDIFRRLIQHCDIMVENFAPGALDRQGFTWEVIHALNPRMIYASIKGFGPGPYEDCKVYENVAQCTGGSASTTGEVDRVPLVTGAQIGDTGTGLHVAIGIVTALYQRTRTGRGQRVTCAMQDGVLNLCRVKLRDQQRLAHGSLKEYPQYPNGTFGVAVPRAGNASGGGQPGWIVKCKGWENDPDAYIYVIAQAAAFPALAKAVGRADWLEDPEWNTPEARLPKLDTLFAEIEKWTMTKTKFEVMNILNPLDVPCGPVLSMKELAEEPSLRETGTVVEVDHPTRGKFLTVGNPIKLSDSITEVKTSPLLGEHTEEVLKEIGYTPKDIEQARAVGAI